MLNSFPKIAVALLLAFIALALGVTISLPAENRELVIVKVRGSTILAEVARDPSSRAQGLGRRNSLPEEEGMLFVFAESSYPSIWMKDMGFALDILWIRNGKIVDLEENAPPPSPGVRPESLPIYTPDVPARLVLEANAGFAKKFKVNIGDEIKIFSEKGQALEFYDPLNNAGVKAGDTGRGGGESIESLPGSEYFIETNRAKFYRGANFRTGETISSNGVYKKVQIFYDFGDLRLTGVMNIPEGDAPPSGFPVLILNHGLIPPEIYFSGRGSRREQDFFARHGYVTIHPDYRFHAIEPGAHKSVNDPSPRGLAHHDFYAGYTEDVLALIAALKEYDSPRLDLSRMGMWGHSMGGGIAARFMTLNQDVRAYVLFAPISADAEDNFYELPEKEVEWLHKTYGEEGARVYNRISPLTYFEDLVAPVQLHHGSADKDVPLAFSEKMFNALRTNGKKVEFFVYPGEGHEFGDAWSLAAERALQFFDKYVMGAR